MQSPSEAKNALVMCQLKLYSLLMTLSHLHVKLSGQDNARVKLVDTVDQLLFAETDPI